MFAWIRSEIIRIELIVVSLSDNLCAQRGEVSQRETPPWSELSMPICTDEGTCLAGVMAFIKGFYKCRPAFIKAGRLTLTH